MEKLLGHRIPTWTLALFLIAALSIWASTALESGYGQGSQLLMPALILAIVVIALVGGVVHARTSSPIEHRSSGSQLQSTQKNHALIELEVSRVLSLVKSRHARDQIYGASLAKAQSDLSGSMSHEALGLLVEHLILENSRAVQDANRSEQELNRARETIEGLRSSLEKATELSLRDPLTEICNRRGFDLYLEQAINSSVANREDLSMIMCDIDHFKSINDKYGHQAGDSVLRLFAQGLAANVRGSDVVCRYGGEEFAVLLPRTKSSDASMIAERARSYFEKTQLALKPTGETIGYVTASFGVTHFRLGELGAHFIRRLDQALYASKNAGRNRVSLL